MKIKMKTRMKKAITFMLTMFILTAALPVNIQAKAVTTPVSQLPEKSDVGQITVTVNSENGTRKYCCQRRNSASMHIKVFRLFPWIFMLSENSILSCTIL